MIHYEAHNVLENTLNEAFVIHDDCPTQGQCCANAKNDRPYDGYATTFAGDCFCTLF